MILNKAMGLVVASASPSRAATVPFANVAANWPIIVNLLAGSLLGAWFDRLGTRLASTTLILLFGADIKLAGSMSLAVSLPTMLVGFARYSRDREGYTRRALLRTVRGA